MLTKPMRINVLFIIIFTFLKWFLEFSLNYMIRCRNLTQSAMSFNDVAITYVKGNGYKIHFWYISKDEAINLLK